MINKEYFLHQIDQYIGAETKVRPSKVCTKHMYDRIHEILDSQWVEDMPFQLSRLMDELAHNYKLDTGKAIGEEV